MQQSIYLAGPDVFWPNAVALGEAKKALCQQYGFTGHFPLDNELDLSALTPYEAGIAIYQANIGLMNQCHIIIANMTPFRGPSMDVGTAFEMGYMTARNKAVWGYTLDGRLYSDRIEGEQTDRDGFSIEAFQMADNLMMVGATGQLGGLLTEALSEDMDNHLRLFERVLQQIQKSR
ncbi:nucleoside 2-deoxyribosyltransferase [Amphritea pacifica]|uniref:Nucleoside 2-deoxyribosyltransferase n=1 Tax=Amphritea pacifica TaxID=2811233 RepID=A0ABS2W928_9GAMM|nr:nucleoside 2-deoxyribosyltransferase [Amphritea pacifica]MBN1007579.1 nucleoside 2-deoxyribosyltransferase [Amphritea pacifica]